MIACEGVGYTVGSRTILHPLSFEAMSGTVTLLQGPSGAGKSTLMSILACVLRPTEGQVLFRGEPVSRYTAAHRDRFRRRVGLVAQRLHLFETMTAVENVLLPGVPRSTPLTPDRAWALLKRFEVPGDQHVRSLSGGEQQRVAIARALALEPELLILDEPTAHQDSSRLDIIASALRDCIARGATIIVAAHDPRLEQALRPDAVFTIEAGTCTRR